MRRFQSARPLHFSGERNIFQSSQVQLYAHHGLIIIIQLRMQYLVLIARKLATTFSIWAPTATSMQSLLLDEQFYSLERQEKGVWQVSLAGDWHGFTYEYEVNINGKTIHCERPIRKSNAAK